MDDNINGNIAKDRDTWMGMEKTLVEGLLKDPKYKEMYEQFRKVPSHELHSKAMELIEDAQRENVKERIWDGNEEEIRAKVQNATEQIIHRIENLPKDKLGEIIKKYGKKNVAYFLSVSALGKSAFKNNLITRIDEQEVEVENPHTECEEAEIEDTEQTARATQEGKGFER